MKRIILILGLVFSMVAVDAKPQKGPKGKGKALKERFEAAKKKRDAKRGDAKKKGHKHKDIKKANLKTKRYRRDID